MTDLILKFWRDQSREKPWFVTAALTRVFENGIRVPLLVRWSGAVEPGDRKQFGCAEDILPTVRITPSRGAKACFTTSRPTPVKRRM